MQRVLGTQHRNIGELCFCGTSVGGIEEEEIVIVLG